MTKDEMKHRTKAYAKRVIEVCEALPDQWVARMLGIQLLRSGTSVAANYRAVCRAKSSADFLNKLKIVEEECDEFLFWMELLVESDLVKANRLESLMREGDEILAIVAAAAKTVRVSSGRPLTRKS
jgi:four helix bundle protein